jgi:hypothetical protein
MRKPWPQTDPTKGVSPFAPATAPAQQSAAPSFEKSPFFSSNRTNTPDSPPESPLLPPTAADQVTAPPARTDDTGVEFFLRSLLLTVPQEALGFDANRVPPSGKVSLPGNDLRAQAASGKVEVPLRTVVSSLDESLQPAFASANLDALVKVSLQEVLTAFEQPVTAAATTSPFRASPAAQPQAALSAPPEPAPVGASRFQTAESPNPHSPFAIPPGQQENRNIEPENMDSTPPSKEPGNSPTAPSSSQETNGANQRSALPSSPSTETPENESDLLEPLKWEPVAGAAASASRASHDANDLKNPLTPVVDLNEESEPLDSLPTATGSPLQPPAIQKPEPPKLNAEPVSGTEAKPVESGLLPPLQGPIRPKAKEPKSEAPKTNSPSADGGLQQLGNRPVLKSPLETEVPQKAPAPGATEPERKPAKPSTPSRGPDFMLRAFLGVNGIPACRDVVEHCSALEGVDECVVLRSGEVVKGTPATGSGRLSDLAAGAFEKVSGFVNEIGICNTEALNLQLEEGTLSFFVHEDACLAVMQNTNGLGPGVTERLTLMSQLLGTIPAEPES